MSLSHASIEESIRKREIEISPFNASNLTPAGYDLRISEKVELKPMEQILVATLERVKLSLKFIAFLHLRSSFAREGLFASLAAVDPGFDGQLTISLFNSSNKVVRISKEEPFVQLVFFKLIEEAEKGYGGKYQYSEGVVKSKRIKRFS
ncbi:MAG: dCTP deaminase [Candidatus Bathyarchaeia archaeon]